MGINSSKMATQQLPLSLLQRAWLRLAIIWLVVWLGSYFLLLSVFPAAWQWLLLSGLVLIYCLWLLRQELPLNHRPHETSLLPTFGPGNQLSLFRALVIGLLAGFLLLPRPPESLAWIIALLYTAAAIADWVDGYVARRTNHVTLLGQKLDMEFDGLGVAVVSLLAVAYGQLPAWFLFVGLARYLFLFGVWWRRRNDKPIGDLPPSVHRRVMAGMLMGMMTVVLWPIVPPEMATIGGAVVAVPVLLGFIRDWLFTAGYLDSDNPVYRRIQRFLYLSMARWFPPIWRLLLVISMLLIMQAVQPWYRPQAWLELLLSWHVPLPELLAAILSMTAVCATILVFLGFIGRLGAILLLFPIGFDIATRGLIGSNGLALICSMCIALLGTGLLSLWQPENKLIVQRRGGSD